MRDIANAAFAVADIYALPFPVNRHCKEFFPPVERREMATVRWPLSFYLYMRKPCAG